VRPCGSHFYGGAVVRAPEIFHGNGGVVRKTSLTGILCNRCTAGRHLP